jgi:hypothetical protein
MKVLVATTATQGTRPSDGCAAADGELVRPPTVEHPGEPVDDHTCGCRRQLVGLDSGQPTTTVQVVQRPDLTPDQLRKAVLASLDRAGAARPGECDSETWAAAVADELLEWAAPFQVGTVLERRGPTLRARGVAGQDGAATARPFRRRSVRSSTTAAGQLRSGSQDLPR